MKKDELMNKWIFKILSYVKNKRGYQNQICLHGHLSPHCFSMDNPIFQLSLCRAMRMIVNYAQVCKDTEKQHEFKDDWNRLGDAIMLLVDNGIVDVLNNFFDSKNNDDDSKHETLNKNE